MIGLTGSLKSGPKQPIDGISTHTAKDGNVTLSVTMARRSAGGAPVVLTCVIENQGKDTVRYSEISLHSVFNILVYDSRGKLVPRTRFGELFKSTTTSREITREIAPNGKKTILVPLGRLFDLTVAGTYSIDVSRVLNETAEKPIRLLIKGAQLEIQEPLD